MGAPLAQDLTVRLHGEPKAMGILAGGALAHQALDQRRDSDPAGDRCNRRQGRPSSPLARSDPRRLKVSLKPSPSRSTFVTRPRSSTARPSLNSAWRRPCTSSGKRWRCASQRGRTWRRKRACSSTGRPCQMSCSEERRPLMIACHGLPCASAAAQAIATDPVRPDTRFERGSPISVRHDALSPRADAAIVRAAR